MSLQMKIKDSTDSFTQIIQYAGITSLLLINYRGNSYNLIRCPLDFEKFLKTLGARSSKSEFTIFFLIFQQNAYFTRSRIIIPFIRYTYFR